MKFEGIYAPYMTQYLQLKKSLGIKLRGFEYNFRQFDRLTIDRNETSVGISKELAEAWSGKRPNEGPGTRYCRLSHFSLFAKYLCDLGFPSVIPEVPKSTSSFTPYIFTEGQILQLFTITDSFIPRVRTHDCSYKVLPTLYRLLYCTGLRISEALALNDKDVNLNKGYLKIGSSKNGQERMLPISSSMADVCLKYRQLNKSAMDKRSTGQRQFFVKEDGSPCGQGAVYANFREIIWKIGIPHSGKGLGPRVHDLRHTYACHALKKMVDMGLDLYCALPILSVYLGHLSLAATEKYLRLTYDRYEDILWKEETTFENLFPAPGRLKYDQTN